MSWKILDKTGAVKTTDASGISNPTQTILTAASGTYTVPAGCTRIFVECVGQGGGGGGVNCATSGQVAIASGGGGGAYAASLIVNPSASYAYAVGQGANGGAAGANNGTAGADTSFGGGIILAKGGGAGNGTANTAAPQYTSGVAGGVGSSCVGQITIDGGGSYTAWSPAATIGIPGAGGAGAVYGVSHQTAEVTTAGNGANGRGYGGGGQGGYRVASTGTQSGGNGANGVIIVTEYYGQPNFTVNTNQITAPAFVTTGLTGATATSRYAGATASGPPSTGNWGVGDYIVDQSGAMWICTVAGSPGTWIAVDDAGRSNPVLRAEFGGSWLAGSGAGSFFCNMDSTPKAAGTLGNQVLSLMFPGTEDVAPTGYKVQWKMKVVYTTNNTNPAVTAVWAPWEITSVGGGAGGYTETGAGAFSSPSTGSVVINAAAFSEANSAWADGSGNLTAGHMYGMGVNLNQNVAANSALRWRGQLWRRFIKA